jgi:AraC-like DNA-binding protein
MQVGREQDRATPGTSLLAGQRGELHTSWEDVALDVVAMDRRLLNEVAAQITDDESAPVHFLAMTAVSASAACYWRTLVRHLEHDVLARDELIAHPLVRHAVVHQVAVGMLAVFPHTTQHRTRRASGAAPAIVRRAMEFIHAHAGDPISVTDIAAAARIGPRGLQLAFRRHHDTTPLDYLRRVRLRGVHADLTAANSTRGDTVSTIATRWGFTHPCQFSRTYRRHYGHPSSTTLRQ